MKNLGVDVPFRYRRAPAVRLARSTIALSLCALAAGCVKAPEGPALCGPNDPCASENATCVLSRCRTKKDAVLALSAAHRLDLAPQAIALVSEHGPSGGDALVPEAVAFGGEALGATTLLLRFAVPIMDKSEVAAAFLVLSPMPSATPPGSPVPIALSRILSPWEADAVSFGRQPSLSVAERAATIAPAPPTPLRLDVTRMVRAWALRSPEDQGIAVIAPPSDPYGVAYSLGISGGRGPRLEVYVR